MFLNVHRSGLINCICPEHLHPSLLRVYNIIYSRVRFRFLYFNVGYFLCPNRPDREAVVLAVGWAN